MIDELAWAAQQDAAGWNDPGLGEGGFAWRWSHLPTLPMTASPSTSPASGQLMMSLRCLT